MERTEHRLRVGKALSSSSLATVETGSKRATRRRLGFPAANPPAPFRSGGRFGAGGGGEPGIHCAGVDRLPIYGDRPRFSLPSPAVELLFPGWVGPLIHGRRISGWRSAVGRMAQDLQCLAFVLACFFPGDDGQLGFVSGGAQAELLVLLAMAVVAERCCRWPPGPGAAVRRLGAVRRLAGPGGATGAARGGCCGGASPRLRIRVSSLFRRLLLGGGNGFPLQ